MSLSSRTRNYLSNHLDHLCLLHLPHLLILHFSIVNLYTRQRVVTSQRLVDWCLMDSELVYKVVECVS